MLLALTLALVLFGVSIVAAAQPAGTTPRIGVLVSFSPEASSPAYALRDGLRELGYVEGQNIVIEWRWGHGMTGRFGELAAELARLKVDVIVATDNPAVAAAQKATRTIPVVMVFPSDPVGLAFIASLARPGGNITGLTSQGRETSSKRVELLREAVPHLSRLAILWDPTDVGRRDQVKEAEAAARALGVRVQLVEARSPNELDSAFVAMRTGRASAVYVQGSAMPLVHRARIAELAARSGLPSMCGVKEFVKAGCLMSYNASFSDLFRRAAYFVDKILKGAKPGDLPVEQASKFELVINARTAKTLGVTVPPALLLRADEVIH
jgi:putative tryptophan/tyrosine transport system substrate-binding protein